MSDSRYGEVNDLMDKVKIYSNLRLKAYECGVHSAQGGEVRDEADLLLNQIEKDADAIVQAGLMLRRIQGSTLIQEED